MNQQMMYGETGCDFGQDPMRLLSSYGTSHGIGERCICAVFVAFIRMLKEGRGVLILGIS